VLRVPNKEVAGIVQVDGIVVVPVGRVAPKVVVEIVATETK
jgi:hypothetical protein